MQLQNGFKQFKFSQIVVQNLAVVQKINDNAKNLNTVIFVIITIIVILIISILFKSEK